ncbi:hypothetical protein QJQ45_001753 [Haematococcus lacustris]|nr:hypothetical protein QJQ45_001753 [Haematococcus lacustris]
MKGKKRKGAAGPKQPKPKQPKPKPKGKPDNLGWVGPVSPQGRALKERLEERAKSRIQFVKCFMKGFIRGRNQLKNKIVTHFRLMVGLSHKKRKLAGLAVLVQLANCMPKLQERSSSRLASRRPLPPIPVPPQPLHILDPLAAHNVQGWTEEFATPSELSGWKQIMLGPAHQQNLRPIPKAFFADPDNAAITAKLMELDKTELAGDSNTIGALAKQMAVNTQEMFANPERYVKLWAKAACSQHGITLEVSKLFVRVVCQYGLIYSSPELCGTPLETPEWQERMAFHRQVLTGVLEDVEEPAAPGDPADSMEPEDPDAPLAITQLPLHRRILYAIYVNRCLEEWQDPNPPAPPPKGEGKGKGRGKGKGQGKGRGKGPRVPHCPPPFILTPMVGTGAPMQPPISLCGRAAKPAASQPKPSTPLPSKPTKPTKDEPTLPLRWTTGLEHVGGAGQLRGRVVLVDEHRTSRVSSAVNGQQPCEEELDKLSATRPAGWKPPAGQVEPRLVRPAWSQERGQPVRGLMWCPAVAPRKPPQAPRSSQAATQPAASEPGPSTPPPAKRSKPAAEPTKGKGKAAKAKPAPQPGRWLDRDCNAALNMQRIGESRWRPLELCYWPDQGALPAKGKEYPGLGYKRVRDKPPKAQQQQQQPAEAQ